MPPRTGERKLQILQILAEMLQEPKAERITTAALAAKLQVSEAALYRHFASKAQMFEGLIEFIEQTVFGLINKIQGDPQSPSEQLHAILTMLLGFAEKNPGMTRVLIGDALVNEDERLQVRINQLHDRLETTIKQSLRVMASDQGEVSEASVRPASRPVGGRPIPAIPCSASAACIVPTIPVRGANTPMMAQRISSGASPSGNRHA